MVEYEILPLDAKTMPYLYELQKAVYGKGKPGGYYEGKYNTAHCGVEASGFFAFKGGRPISFAGLLPAVFSIAGQEAMGAQSADTMTVPGSQRKGICTALAREAAREARSRGVDFIYGFANQVSIPWLRESLHFIEAGRMQRFTISYNDQLLGKIWRRLFKKRPAYATLDFENSLLKEGFDGLLYSPGYLRYKRYAGNFLFSSAGHTVWLSPGGAAVGALDSTHPRECVQLIRSAFRPSSITFMCSPGTALCMQLNELAPPQWGFWVAYRNLSMRHDLSNLRFQLADVDIF